MNIIAQYNVRFFRKDIHGSIFNGLNTISPLLDQLISDDQNIEDVNETIDALNAVIAGEVNSINYSGESQITLVANSTSATIYADPEYDNTTPSFSLPTEDLKELAQEWKDFLMR